MSHWSEPMPDFQAPDPLEKPNQPPHPAEWRRCVHCGKWVTYRVGAGHWTRSTTCYTLECNLKEDRLERQRVMTPAELAEYYRTAEAYFSRPEDPSATGRPLKASRGLVGLSAREQERISLKRAQDELDEREARERNW